MAQNKKSFVLYQDQRDVFVQLPDDIAGRLIKHVFSYVSDENPVTDDLIINIAFAPIKQQLKRDLAKYEEVRNNRSEAGKMGMAKRWSNERNNAITNDNSVTSQLTNITVTDNVNVTVTDNVNNINSMQVKPASANIKESLKLKQQKCKEREAAFYEDLKPYVHEYGKEMIRSFYEYWKEPDEQKTKMKRDYEKTWDLARRLKTWHENDSRFKSKKIYSSEQQSAAEKIKKINSMKEKIAEYEASGLTAATDIPEKASLDTQIVLLERRLLELRAKAKHGT